MLPIGAFIIWLSTTLVEVDIEYQDKCQMVVPVSSTSGAKVCTISNLKFTIDREMKKPVYLYYRLSNFYQNHRRYAQSRSDTQLAGGAPLGVGDCSPLSYCGELHGQPNDGTDDEKASRIYSPCGLIAWSMFNDTFHIRDPLGNTICDSGAPTMGTCSKDGIAWASDRDKKFRPPPIDSKNIHSLPGKTAYYCNESSHPIPMTTDEDLMVWMRTAALPNFRKLHRIIQHDLPPGEYSIDIQQNYPVEEFGGRKSVVLATTSWIGGRNLFMGIAYVIVGLVCIVLAGLFGIKALASLKKF